MKIWDRVNTIYWEWIIVDFEEHSKIEVNRYWVKLDKPTKWIDVSYFFSKNITLIKKDTLVDELEKEMKNRLF